MSEKKEFIVPDFLRKENMFREPDPTEAKINALRDKYIERFGKDVEDNISIPLTREDWIDVLTTCLEQNITFEDLTGFGGYDDDDDDDY